MEKSEPPGDYGPLFQRYLAVILAFASKTRSMLFKSFALLMGGTMFLVVIPFLLYLSGEALNAIININWPAEVEIPVAALSVCAGLFFLLWAVWAQLTIGRGTPAPIAPTSKLIVTGPYNLCRNPIQLGACLYYLGIVTWVAGLMAGIVSFALGMALGSFYHKVFEEKELLARFGDDYLRYKETTPFIIPRLRIR
ncbi:MAG: isoprenylcysteine carboxylmethyltransferase family protein [Nitrospinae bacterium]|nr:isoprenylcysteine carboxylmethyltransferase family protein [Nitrospinota bacterium]